MLLSRLPRFLHAVQNQVTYPCEHAKDERPAASQNPTSLNHPRGIRGAQPAGSIHQHAQIGSAAQLFRRLESEPHVSSRNVRSTRAPPRQPPICPSVLPFARFGWRRAEDEANHWRPTPRNGRVQLGSQHALCTPFHRAPTWRFSRRATQAWPG